MLDVHVPQKSEHTWTDFLLHIATICVGLLIAIGLEQTVEHLHQRHEREVLIEDFRRECANNLKVFDHDLDVLRAGITWEHASLAVLRNAQPQGGYITVTLPLPPSLNNVVKAPSRSVWSVAKSSGKVALLPEDLAEVFDRVDHEGELWSGVQQPINDAFVSILTFADRAGSPLITGATIHLSLAQRDDATGKINDLLVHSEQMKTWISYWKSASLSVLRGVHSRDEMDDDLERASPAANAPSERKETR